MRLNEMRFIYAFIVTWLAEYLNSKAESAWYPLAPDMRRWLAIAIALFVFFGVLKIFETKHSSLD